MTERSSYFDSAQREIEALAQNILGLKQELPTKERALYELVQNYQKERYRRQEEIWQDHGLIRCTLCFNVPPGWGLMPADEAHYISIRGDHWHTSHESDYHHTHLLFHRLCGHCYLEKLKNQATGTGGFRDLNPDQVEAINSILEKYGNTYQGDQKLTRMYGHYSEIEIYWHQLHIPKGAYEIGTTIKIEDLLKKPTS